MKIHQLTIISIFIVVTFSASLHINTTGLQKFNRQKFKQNHSKQKHFYYNVQQTQRVSKSKSIQYLNKCKDECLKFYKIFPFQFKYHRKIYRQSGLSKLKYITGQCLYSFRQPISKQQTFKNKQENQKEKKENTTAQKFIEQKRKWYPFKDIQKFLSMVIVENQEFQNQKENYQTYMKKCQDQSMKISQESMENLKFTMVHSDFQYYQNDGFNNLKPFDDLEELLSGLASNP